MCVDGLGLTLCGNVNGFRKTFACQISVSVYNSSPNV
jgi:hypothetical protein